jgi:hypothetical protein
VEDLKKHVEQTEYTEFHKNIHDLGKQIVNLEKRIIERDISLSTIQAKEKIYDIYVYCYMTGRMSYSFI